MTPGWVRSGRWVAPNDAFRKHQPPPNRSLPCQGQTTIPLQVDLALLIGPLLLRADISFLSSRLSCSSAQAADGSRGPGVLVLGFVKFEAGIARIIARPDGLARGSEQLGGGGGAGGGMCHARAWINWWCGVAASKFQSTSSESDVTVRNVRSLSPKHYAQLFLPVLRTTRSR